MGVPSGKLLHSNGKIPPFLMGKSTISMAMFNCYVSSPEGNLMGSIWAQLTKDGINMG